MRVLFIFFVKQKTAYEMRISDWSSDVCSSDLRSPEMMMLSSPRRPDSTIRIFSSAEYCLRVLRRMSRIAVSAPSFKLMDFSLIFVPFGHYDEPEILRYANTSTRSEEHTSELQSLMRISYAVFCLKKKKKHITHHHTYNTHKHQ